MNKIEEAEAALNAAKDEVVSQILIDKTLSKLEKLQKIEKNNL